MLKPLSKSTAITLRRTLPQTLLCVLMATLFAQCVQRNPTSASGANPNGPSDPNVFRPSQNHAPIVLDPTRIPGSYGLMIPVIDAGVEQ